MKDFFISYTENDIEWAKWIAWHLKEAGYTIIIQVWDFRTRKNFISEMNNAIENSEQTIALMSPDYFKSKYAEMEWTATLTKNSDAPLMGIMVEECEPPALLKPYIYFKLIGLDEATAKEKLIEGVKGGPVKPDNPPGFPKAGGPKFPGSLPPVWNVPHRRNRNFTGRESLLKQLREKLNSGKPAALTQAIRGLGGVGKTQLALEYIYRYAAEYKAVWWLRAEESATLAGDLADIAAALCLPEAEGTDQKTAIMAVHRWLAGNNNWLLVYDNAPDAKSIHGYLPQAATGHIIITSRDQAWLGTAEPLDVKVLERSESVAFLLKRTGREDATGADQLADVLGDLPLALEQAAAYMDGSKQSFTGYLELFKSRRKELWDTETPPDDYDETTATTWSLAMEEARKKSPAADNLLKLCAYLASDDIPLDLLLAGKEKLPDSLAEVVEDQLKIDAAVSALRHYSLITTEDKLISVHRLVQAVARDRAEKTDGTKWAEAALELVNNQFPFDSDDVRTWPQCSRLLPHALTVAEHAERLEILPETAGRLLNQSGLYLKGRADFAEAKNIYERASILDEKAYGPNHPSVAIRVSNLGSVLKELGDLKGAKANFERALKIDEKTYGPDHPDVAIYVNNLGAVLQDLGDLEGAKANFERALKIDEKAYGPDHPNVAIRVNNLGEVLRALGDFEGAKAHYERALKIGEIAYGSDHPQVATYVNNLAGVLFKLGDFKASRANLKYALRIFQKFLGDDHPSTRNVREGLEYVESLLKNK